MSWDNLRGHNSARARRPIEAAGCQVLATPRSSPDCHRTERAFSKIKTTVRCAEVRLFDAIVSATVKRSRRSPPPMRAPTSPPPATPLLDNLHEFCSKDVP